VPPDAGTLRTARRRLIVDTGGIAVSAVGFGIVFGLTARGAGFSLVEAIAFSTLVFAGASQFAAAGMVASGFGWGAIVLLTGLVNARHLLYAAALAPWLRDRPRPERAAMAHVLTDESFALSLVHFRRLGLTDRRGYWIAAVGGVFIPWNVATIVGHVGGQVIPDPAVLGLDVVFPAAMAGLAVGLATGRREVVALAAGVAIALAVGLTVDPRVGVVAGGVLGPLAGLAVPRRGGPAPEPVDLPGEARSPAQRASDDGMAP
jgi:4-azaleucine resistance transporter AzlC